jgi:hypothetical protein
MNLKIDPPYTPSCNKTMIFGGNRLQCPVWKLEENTLYHPEGKQFPVVEWIWVDHALRKVFGHQVTKSQLSDHVFKIETVNKLLNDLEMNSTQGKEYKFVLIGVNDLSLRNPNGMLFTNGDGKDNKKSLSEWKDDGTWEYASRIETVIARVPVFDMDGFQLPPGNDSNKTTSTQSNKGNKRQPTKGNRQQSNKGNKMQPTKGNRKQSNKGDKSK